LEFNFFDINQSSSLIFQSSSAAHSIRYLSTNNQEIPKNRTEIYYGNLTRQIKALKYFSLFTSTGSILSQPFLYLKAMESGNTGAIVGIFAFVGFLAMTTPLLIHFITKKYITHLYYDAEQDKYIANTYSLFVRKKEVFISYIFIFM
jgi:transmembrane protein 70